MHRRLAAIILALLLMAGTIGYSPVTALAEEGGIEQQYNIIATADEGGSISPSGTVSVAEGESITFTITPDTGCRIVSVLVDDEDQGAIPSYTFDGVGAIHTIHATFEEITYYNITATAGEGGSISPSGTVAAEEGGSVTFNITPDDCYFIASVLVDGEDQGAISSYTFDGVSAPHTIQATFKLNVADKITDAALLSAVRSRLNIPSGPITADDMKGMTFLSGAFRDINSLAGLEYATNLRILNLEENDISDLSPLSGLTKLTEVDLSSNNISDISPLAGLTQLETLRLSYNNISNLSPLSGLPQLKWLYLSSNEISDVSPLAGVPQLRSLNLLGNEISDISPLAGMSQLLAIDLSNNRISDISPAAALPNLQTLYSGYNSISDISALSQLKKLTSLEMPYNNISDISVLSSMPDLLDNLDMRNNSIRDISPLAGLTISWIMLSNNNISDITALGEMAQKADSFERVDLDNNYLNLTASSQTMAVINAIYSKMSRSYLLIYSPQKALSATPFEAKAKANGVRKLDLSWEYMPDTVYEVIRTGPGGTETVLSGSTSTAYTDTGLLLDTEYTYVVKAHIWQGEGVTPVTVEKEVAARTGSSPVITDKIKDGNLRQAILARLEAESGPITVADMLSITTLSAIGKDISDLSGLEYAANLEELDLWNNKISDISPLSVLTKLTELDLGSNSVSDISALSALTNLEELNLRKNAVSDISPLSGLTNLTELVLESNAISDVSALSPLKKLTGLNLNKNAISDVSALSALTDLTWLYLEDNNISDISALSALTKLTYLDLGKNSVSDISALSALTNLIGMSLQENRIRDISPLAGLAELWDLDLRDNHISDISVLETLTAEKEYFLLVVMQNYLNLTDGSRTMDAINAVSGRVEYFYYNEQKPLSETPFEAKAAVKGESRVDVSWDYMPDTVYEVLRTGGGETKTLLSNSTGTSYTDTDVEPAVVYEYTIKAHIWQGEGVNPVTVQKTVSINRTLTDSSTGVTVSGIISDGAVLIIEDIALGDSPADNAIRARMQDNGYVSIWSGNISLTGSFTGTLTVSLPVGAQYNGQTVIVMHAKQDGSLETYNVVVQDGCAAFEVTSLSPFAVFLKNGQDNIPRTGDNSTPWVWWLLGSVSAAGMGLLPRRKKAGGKTWPSR